MALPYECPQNFEAESFREDDLKVSDVKKDDIELWLIKSPVDFNISKLSGHKLKTKFSIHSETNDNIKYVVKKNPNTSELNSYQCLFPHDTKETLTLGPSLQGQFDITKVLKIPVSTDIQIPNKVTPHFPSGLKQRYIPFGSSSPKCFSRKRRSVNRDAERCEFEMNGFETGSTKKKKKHKKSKRESVSSDVLDEVADSEMMMMMTQEVETRKDRKIRKHKKKKKEREEEEDLDESIPLVDDSEIPSQLLIKDYCAGRDNEDDSQRVSKHKKKKKHK